MAKSVAYTSNCRSGVKLRKSDDKGVPPGHPYLLLRCTAEQIALRDSSVDLVIATPPYYGVPDVPRKDCCPRSPRLYGAFLARCLAEAGRIVKPGGYILVHTGKAPLNRVNGSLEIVFNVLRKSICGESVRRNRSTVTWVKNQKFQVHLARVKGISWYALPLWLYRTLIDRYSLSSARVVHTFSGTGNSGIAALSLSRIPILLDLHHHRQVQRRLDKILRSQQKKIARRLKFRFCLTNRDFAPIHGLTVPIRPGRNIELLPSKIENLSRRNSRMGTRHKTRVRGKGKRKPAKKPAKKKKGK